MDTRRLLLLLSWLGLTTAGVAVVVAGVRSSHVERRPARPLPDEAPAATAYPSLPTPAPAEVAAALRRVFGDVLLVDPPRSSYWVADFNGDGSEDLAAAARPRPARVAEINAPFANWIVQDAERPPSLLGNAKPRRPTVVLGDRLLAVIHGDGAAGWRDREARQAYLVREGAGLPLELRRPHEVVAALPPSGARPPRIVGDVLIEAGPRVSRFIYWTGVRYLWHAPGRTAVDSPAVPHG